MNRAALARHRRPDPDRHVVMALIPIGGLLPGDFIVRAIISIEGKPAARVLRTLRTSSS